MSNHTLFIIVSIVLVLGIFSSIAYVTFAEPIKVTDTMECKTVVIPKTGKQTQECCITTKNEFGKETKTCHYMCTNKYGREMLCSKSIEGTLNPDITGGAGAGVLQDNDTNSRDTNTGNNGGILQDNGTSNRGNNTGVMNSSIVKNGSKTLIDKNKVGIAPYIGDPSTWNCKLDEASGKNICSCKGGSDCLHCRVYGRGECKPLPGSNLADVN